MTSRFLCCATAACCLCAIQNTKGDTNGTLNVPSHERATPMINKSASGLSWIVLRAPATDAKRPTKGKKVTVHYTGWLYDEKAPDNKGEKFDSSVDRGQEFKFVIGVGQVIKGWDEGVADMAVGEKRRLIIPAELAYGSRAVGGKIPANAKLVFDVELIGVE